MKPPYFEFIRFIMRTFVTGRSDAIPENRQACAAVWKTLTAQEQDLIEYFVTSNAHPDVLITRKYAELQQERGMGTISPDRAWTIIRRVFRDVAVARGIWPNDRKEQMSYEGRRFDR